MRVTALLLATMAAPALAQEPPPPPPGVVPPPSSMPSTAAPAYMAMAGESDVFEIATSQIALMRSRNADVRAFAAMLIEHHTMTTNALLAGAKAAGLTPPPAALSPRRIALVDQLDAVAPADFDRAYLMQQVPAHEEALAIHRTYASGGDTPQLRSAASGAIPFVERHLAAARARSR
jgi:putative membrane protein